MKSSLLLWLHNNFLLNIGLGFIILRLWLINIFEVLLEAFWCFWVLDGWSSLGRHAWFFLRDNRVERYSRICSNPKPILVLFRKHWCSRLLLPCFVSLIDVVLLLFNHHLNIQFFLRFLFLNFDCLYRNYLFDLNFNALRIVFLNMDFHM